MGRNRTKATTGTSKPCSCASLQGKRDCDSDIDMEADLTGSRQNCSCSADDVIYSGASKKSCHRHHQGCQIVPPVRKHQRPHEFPIHTIGILSYITYSWMTKFAWKVYRRGQVNDDEMWCMPPQDGSAHCGERMNEMWKKEVRQKGSGAASMGLVLLHFIRTRFILAMILYLLNLCFSFLGSTFILHRILEYSSSENSDVRYGLSMCAALFAVELCKCVTLSVSSTITSETAKRTKGALLHILFDKLLRLKSLNNRSVGEVVNLCTNDTQRLTEVLQTTHYALGGAFMIIAGTVYCCIMLGPWPILGACLMLLYYPYQYAISKVNAMLRRKCVSLTDQRVRMMNEILTSIKLIKLYAWETPFARSIADLRTKERKILEKAAFLYTMSSSISPVVPVFAAVGTFTGYVLGGNSLTATEAFVMITILSMTRVKLTCIPLIVARLSETRVALERIQAFLAMEEAVVHYSPVQDPLNAIEMTSVAFAWPSPGKTESAKSTPTSSSCAANHTKKVQTRDLKMTNLDLENEKGTLLHSDLKSMECLSSAIMDINLKIPKGQLCGVCGKVGSGKSSLLSGLLGQMVEVSGTVGLQGCLAYVPQQPWIINDTLKENILFGRPFDEQRYNETVAKCCLLPDISILPAGENTEIGERGITLSGGQKQRVSLARAMYSDRDVYLLDDPLSAVDSQVGQSLFRDCLQGELKSKTVLLVTHQLQYLQHCDYILHMESGRISEQGTHQQLMAADKDYAALMRTFHSGGEAAADVGQQDSTLEISESERLPDAEKKMRSSSFTSVSSATDSESELDEPVQQDSAGRLMVAEDREHGAVSKSTYLAYIHAAGGYAVTWTVLLLYALPVACVALNHWWLSYWINQGSGDEAVPVNSSNATLRLEDAMTDNPYLKWYATVYCLSAIAIVLAYMLHGFAHLKVTLRASSQLHKEMFTKIIHCPMSFFDTTPVGRMVNRFARDMDEVDVRLPIRLETLLRQLSELFMSFAIISLVFPWFLLSLIPFALVFGIFYRIMQVCLRETKRTEAVSRSPLLSHLTTAAQGIHTIRAYGRQQHFLDKFHELLDNHSVLYFLFPHVNRWLTVRMDLLNILLVTLTAVFVVTLKGTVPASYAGLALTYAIAMVGRLQFSLLSLADAQAFFVSVQRLLYYIKHVPCEAASLTVDNHLPPDWPARGAVTYKDYYLRYRPGLPLALKGISCHIRSREKVGIVGRTGSGKSSLAVGLFRLVEPVRGTLYIDDINITSVGLQDLRSRLSVIPQDPVLFAGTIRYNLDPFEEHRDAELWQALEKCHITDMVSTSEGQLQAAVVENGANFSVGERQLICIARALLRQSKVLVLDEATASIDTETDSKIQQTIQKAFTDCTVLTIAHRLNTILHCDRIMVLRNGRIVEFDTPSELQSNPTSHFACMMAATGLASVGNSHKE